MDIESRIDAALTKVVDGSAPMSIPPDETDVDLVLSDANKEIKHLRGLMRSVVEQLDRKNRGSVDAPGHCHDIPGVWDMGNGDLSGKPCAWCALWKEAKAAAMGNSAPTT